MEKGVSQAGGPEVISRKPSAGQLSACSCQLAPAARAVETPWHWREAA